MLGWVLPLLVLGALAMLPWLAESRRHAVDVFRDKAPGRFAKLSQGVTHYQWLGDARGPVVVCIHGLATPSPVWYAIAGGLAKLGYRVLVYDLYGRGFSDAPRGAQDGAFFATQLADLLEHQELTDDVTLRAIPWVDQLRRILQQSTRTASDASFYWRQVGFGCVRTR